MVSSLSSRLLAKKEDPPSRDETKGSTSVPNHLRNGTGPMKTRTTITNDKNGSSMSGYSADRESPSTAFPPVVSINLHSKSKSTTRGEALKCPKRRKKNEMQFAATTVKADLARAGKTFQLHNKNLEKSTILQGLNINLKDHVRLIHSNEMKGNVVRPGNVAKPTTADDYIAIFEAVSSFYPSKGTQVSDIDQALPTGQNAWSDPSTSSVSDTLSDSGSDNTTNSLPPLLEHSLDSSSKGMKKKQKRMKTKIDSSRVMSSVSSPISMCEVMQLSKTPRVVTEASAPFHLIYANAAFHRLTGSMPSIIGKSFLSLLDPKSHSLEDNTMSLEKFVATPDQGVDHIFWLLPRKSSNGDVDEVSKPMKCSVRVSPILDHDGQSELHEQFHVSYFVLEFVPEGKEFDESSITRRTSVSFVNESMHMGVVA